MRKQPVVNLGYLKLLSKIRRMGSTCDAKRKAGVGVVYSCQTPQKATLNGSALSTGVTVYYNSIGAGGTILSVPFVMVSDGVAVIFGNVMYARLSAATPKLELPLGTDITDQRDELVQAVILRHCSVKSCRSLVAGNYTAFFTTTAAMNCTFAFLKVVPVY